MAEQTTPRRMIKALLQGELPPRPLLLPIIFSLGARLENLPLRDFQSNPTKIANALRQIRSVLKVDGLTCYFDPFLEAEALGCAREWKSDGLCVVKCPLFSGADDFREKLNSPDMLTDKGHIPIACEVLRRLKVMLKDEPALMVGVTGPFGLAAQLLGADAGGQNLPFSLPSDLVQFTAEVTASVSKCFVESGADVVFLVESLLPEISCETCEWWESLLTPTINVIRFYEALPVLLLNSPTISQASLAAILSRNWECVACPVLKNNADHQLRQNAAGIGVGLPFGFFGQSQASFGGMFDSIRELISDQGLTLVTSEGDIPPGDLKPLTEVLDALRRAFSWVA